MVSCRRLCRLHWLALGGDLWAVWQPIRNHVGCTGCLLWAGGVVVGRLGALLCTDDRGWDADGGGEHAHAFTATPPPALSPLRAMPMPSQNRNFTSCPTPRTHHAASWDPRREGSLLGWTELKANLPLLLDRFKRN